ncbi:hypothetical protein [Nitratireductor alexandrii]|uniref:hypothetical protein n=1 Tax=Nitratireductor alexandrii TaxID=2448161 RepID=UPI000FD9E310|nr:hypothetical protein [Nitratireductor alexandrii]
MADDSTSGGSNANNGQSETTSEAFNRQNTLEAEIAALSPQAQERARFVQELGKDQLEAEKKAQQRSHAHRVMKVQIGLLENYVRDRSARPEEIRADPEPDLQVIRDQAERMVQQREAFYREQTQRVTEQNLRQIIAMDRRGQFQSEPEQEHDQEHD